MPESEPDFGSIRVLHGEYDCIMVLPVATTYEEYKLWLAEWQTPIVEYALSQECSYIAFDRDADTDDRFETYEW